MLKPKYKLSGRPLFLLACQGGNSPLQLRHWSWCIVFTCSKLSLQLQQDTSWWRSLVYGRACKLSHQSILVELILGWKGGNTFTSIFT